MKIAILYICTGRYDQFWPVFYQSSEQFFLPEISKRYFVFTDNYSIAANEKVHLIKKTCKGFPLDSLFRFEMFLEIEKELLAYDYIFFFNSNMQFVAPVGNEILPQKNEGGIVAVLHPGYFNKSFFWYPFERNRSSTAFIHNGLENYRYYMGGINGGISHDYLELAKTCSKNIRTDYEKGIIAVFHDESHINKYLSNRKCLILGPEYGFPEGSRIKLAPKIIIRNKVLLDKYFDKQNNKSLLGILIRKFNDIIETLLWFK